MQNNTGGALTNIAYQPVQPDGQNIMVFMGIFRDGQSQTNAQVDPDVGTNFQSILESGNYRRVYAGGRPLTTTWYNATGFKGINNTVGTPTSSSTLTTAFAGSVPTWDQPHGWDIMFRNRGDFLNPAVVTWLVQIAGSAVIRVANRDVIYN